MCSECILIKKTVFQALYFTLYSFLTSAIFYGIFILFRHIEKNVS